MSEHTVSALPGSSDEPLLTAQEVADLLRLDIDSVYGLIHDGALQGHRIGRKIRVPRVAYRAYLEATRISPALEGVA